MSSEHDANNGHLDRYLKAIDEHDDELASLRGSYMQQCKGPREGIREIKGELREAGENMKAFNVLLKGHRADRAQQKRIAELEQEDVEALEDMERRLGILADTPLGQSALDRKRKRDDGSDARA
jgi:hypothetical protein